MQNVCNNAYQQYVRSRPAASSESNKRIKELNISVAGILPEFRDSNNSTAELISKMKSYRPRGVITKTLYLIRYNNLLKNNPIILFRQFLK
jgi:ATP-dependent RNA helicase DDX54/DBP10